VLLALAGAAFALGIVYVPWWGVVIAGLVLVIAGLIGWIATLHPKPGRP